LEPALPLGGDPIRMDDALNSNLAIAQFFFFSEEWACGSRIPLFGQAGFEGWVGLSMLRVA
jgi:hypothetical protein